MPTAARSSVKTAGLGEFTPDQCVGAYQFGDHLPAGIEAIEIASLCRRRPHCFIPWARRVAFRRRVVRMPADGPLGFVPDFLLGDDPIAVKRDLIGRVPPGALPGFRPHPLAHGLPGWEAARTAPRLRRAGGSRPVAPDDQAAPTRSAPGATPGGIDLPVGDAVPRPRGLGRSRSRGGDRLRLPRRRHRLRAAVGDHPHHRHQTSTMKACRAESDAAWTSSSSSGP